MAFISAPAISPSSACTAATASEEIVLQLSSCNRPKHALACCSRFCCPPRKRVISTRLSLGSVNSGDAMWRRKSSRAFSCRRCRHLSRQSSQPCRQAASVCACAIWCAASVRACAFLLVIISVLSSKASASTMCSMSSGSWCAMPMSPSTSRFSSAPVTSARCVSVWSKSYANFSTMSERVCIFTLSSLSRMSTRPRSLLGMRKPSSLRAAQNFVRSSSSTSMVSLNSREKLSTFCTTASLVSSRNLANSRSRDMWRSFFCIFSLDRPENSRVLSTEGSVRVFTSWTSASPDMMMCAVQETRSGGGVSKHLGHWDTGHLRDGIGCASRASFSSASLRTLRRSRSCLAAY
mmetsp:Transcript_21279/g.47271  ORF Transcript_21279/g.47271 Transcript_21279/m.47271 type:complete len:349 (+) Transcript_21279:558-1604(+)